MGLPELKFGAEYDGEEFHGPEEQDHDEERREWLRTDGGWLIEVARRQHIHGQRQDIHLRLRRGYEEALLTAARR